MRHITTIVLLIQLFFALPLAAQQWEQFQLPPQPFSYAHLLHCLQGNVYYCGWDGLYRSTDKGDNWQRIRDYQPVDGFQVLEADYKNNRLYYSQGYDTSGLWSLYRSTNLGNSWTYIGNVAASVEAFIGDTIYGASFINGIEIWKKWGAQNWMPLPNFPKDTAGLIHSVCADGQHLWAATQTGLYHSPDAGYTWSFNRQINNIPISTPNNPNYLRIKALNGEIVLTNEFDEKIYYSNNAGGTWEEGVWSGKRLFTTAQHIFATDRTGVLLYQFEGGSVSAWKVYDLHANDDILVDGIGEINGALFLSGEAVNAVRKLPEEDKWEPCYGDYEYYWESDKRLRFWDGHLFLIDKTSSFSSDNGASWEHNLSSAFPYEVWSNGPFDYMLWSGNTTPKKILRCPRNQRFEWETHSILPDITKRVAASGDTLLGTKIYAPYKLFQSLDNGATWNTLPAPFGGVTIHSRQGKFFCMHGKYLYSSSNAGQSWDTTYTFPTVMDESVSPFYMVKDTIILTKPSEDLVLYSPDGGLTFDTLVAPKNSNLGTFQLRYRGGLLILNMNDGVLYFSKDIGRTWNSVPAPPNNSLTQTIADDSWAYGNNTIFTYGAWRLRLDQQRQVSGQVFLDLNGNGLKDVNEKGVDDLVVKSAQNGVLSSTYNKGRFSMLLGQLTDTVSLSTFPPHYVSNPAFSPIPSGLTSIPPLVFGLKPQGTVNDASIILNAEGHFKSGFTNQLFIHVKNIGTIPNSGQIKLVLSPEISFVSATPSVDLIVGDTLIWNYVGLGLFDEKKIKVSVQTAVAPPGSAVKLSASLSNGADIDLTNNTALLFDEILASFDPNDKSVSVAQVPLAEIDQEELLYTIRFQNLGNTETDFISVRDTLVESLDATTVRMVASSHPFDWRIEDGRILVFKFNPIKLSPAALDSLNSQGFIQFAVRLTKELQAGDEITNTGHIYFDFNPAIVTNTVITSITLVSVFEPQAQVLEIFPNPASDHVTFRLPEGNQGTGKIDLFPTTGKWVFSSEMDSQSTELKLPNLPTGTYWCRWIGTGRSFWGKLVVIR